MLIIAGTPYRRETADLWIDLQIMAERTYEYKVVEKLNKKGEVIKREEYHKVKDKGSKDGAKRGGKQSLAIEGPDET